MNIRGHYQDIADVVALFISLFNLPTTGLKAIVVTILGRVGIADTAKKFFIPDLYVWAIQYDVTWKATYMKTTGSFSGSKYTVTQEGYAGQEVYSGNYFSPSAFASHKTVLASALHDCINVYWGDGPYDVIWN